MRLLALFLVAIMLISFTNSYAATVGNSEAQLPDNYYASGMGIIKYQKQDLGPCTFAIPNYSVKSVNSTAAEKLNLDNFLHDFFIVLGNHNNESYDYLQTGLPSGSGLPSYFLDLMDDDGKRLRGEFYSGYDNLAVVLESDTEKIPISENSAGRYFSGESKDITSSTHTFGSGNYTFGAFLLKSTSSWVDDEKCVIHLKWPFVIDAKGNISTFEPLVEVGKLVSVTEEFSPLRQHMAGVNPDSIDCKPVLRLLLQQADNSGGQRPVCVTPETKAKLIERGWIKTQTKNFATHADSQKLLALLEAGQVEEFNRLKASLIISSNPFLSLNGTNFQGLDLRGIDLTNVHIAGTDMQNANLQGIVLVYRNIQDTDFQRADLSNADLSDAWLDNVNMVNANLHNANLKNTHLGHTNISYANLQGADLRSVDFQYSVMNDTNFHEADMRGSNLSETILRNIDFENADLQFAIMKYADLTGANLKNTNMINANLDNANLRGADLSGADLKNARLDNANLLETNLSKVTNLPISKEDAKQRGAIIE